MAHLCPSSSSSTFLICQDFRFNHSTEFPATNLYCSHYSKKRSLVLSLRVCHLLWGTRLSWVWVTFPTVAILSHYLPTRLLDLHCTSSILVQGYRCLFISFNLEFCSCFLFSFLLSGDFSEKREIALFMPHFKTRSLTLRESFACYTIFSFSSASHMLFQSCSKWCLGNWIQV